MPESSFNINEILPDLLTGTVISMQDKAVENHGLSGMAKENKPQTEPKVLIKGKVWKGKIAKDIPLGASGNRIKDDKSTFEYFTAMQYGQIVDISADELLLNPAFGVGFNSVMKKGTSVMLSERIATASTASIEMIKRAQDKQVKQLLDNCKLVTDNYEVVDFGQDPNNNFVITTANLKWTIANAATMKPYADIAKGTEQIAKRGNTGGAPSVCLIGENAYEAYVNCEDYKDDSNQRRNYKVEVLAGVTSDNTPNVPKGAIYRESIIKNTFGIVHIFTYHETYTSDTDVAENWLGKDKVWIVSTQNQIIRQPVMTPTMANLMPTSAEMKRYVNSIPSAGGWLVHPEWNECTLRNLAIGIYRKFLTIPLTPNKMYSLTANS